MDEMQETILEYVIEEYLEEDDEDVDVHTPLISGGIVDSFSIDGIEKI